MLPIVAFAGQNKGLCAATSELIKIWDCIGGGAQSLTVLGQKIQDSPLVWQMRPHTPEALALLLLIRLLLMLELFTSKAREEAGQLFLQEAHRQQKRKLPSAGSRRLVPEDEEGSLPLPSSG